MPRPGAVQPEAVLVGAAVLERPDIASSTSRLGAGRPLRQFQNPAMPHIVQAASGAVPRRATCASRFSSFRMYDASL
jgi:hypothetical protein